jgi:hypothetical protein
MGNSIMSKLRLHGDTSGYVDLQAPAVAGTTTIDLGTILTHDGNGNIVASGATFTGNVVASGAVTIQSPWSGNSTGGTLSLESNDTVGTAFRMKASASSKPLGWSLYTGTSGSNITDGGIGFWDHDEFNANGSAHAHRWFIDATGAVHTPDQPGCMIYCQGADINWYAGDVIKYGDNSAGTSIKAWDTTNSYDMVNSRYVAPVAGKYYVSFTANGVYTGTVPRAYPRINGSNLGNSQHIRGNNTITGDLDQRTYAGIVHMNANDYLDVQVQQGQWDTFSANYFCMYKLS